MKLGHARRHDAAFFRMSHHRIAEIPGVRVRLLNLTHDRQNMVALLRRTDITAQHRITALQLIDIGDALRDLAQVAGRHDAAGPLAVLRMVGELHRVQRPDVDAHAAHRKLSRTVAGVTKHHVRLDRKNVFHRQNSFGIRQPGGCAKIKGPPGPLTVIIRLLPIHQAVVFLAATQQRVAAEQTI